MAVLRYSRKLNQTLNSAAEANEGLSATDWITVGPSAVSFGYSRHKAVFDLTEEQALVDYLLIYLFVC